MIKGFRDFLLRGNVIELAVAVIIGAAFTAIVNSMVADIITPILGLAGGLPDFSNWRLLADANGAGGIALGNFFNAVISFVITALVVYFLIVVPANRALAVMKRDEPPPAAPELTMDQKLLTEIRDALARQQPR
ncbi:MAG: large conductance mechanosensitive channel protein MscL [Roseiflexaceae bacterium]|nr:large conductance mechanosensitive channel protein MscL [Roseiflexaceae bacterium]